MNNPIVKSSAYLQELPLFRTAHVPSRRGCPMINDLGYIYTNLSLSNGEQAYFAHIKTLQSATNRSVASNFSRDFI